MVTLPVVDVGQHKLPGIIPIPQRKSYIGTVVAVIPAYNEARYIGSVILQTLKYVDAVIVVDDGSADETADIAALAGAIVVKHGINQGKGAALNTGFEKARSLLIPSAVVTLDGDWQHLPDELPHVVKPVLDGQADIVIGSRYLENTSEIPFQRILGHWGFTRLINTLSGAPVTDSQSGYRAFSLRALESIRFSSRGFSVESEMQFVASDHELKIQEVPITIRYHAPPKRSLFSHGFKVLTGILKLIGQHRPLLFFSVPGLFILLTGLATGISAIDAYQTQGHLMLLNLLLASILCLIGGMSMFTGLVLHSIRGIVLELLNARSSTNAG